MEVSPPQLSAVQQEPPENTLAQLKPGLSYNLQSVVGLKVRKVSGTPVRSLLYKSNRVKLTTRRALGKRADLRLASAVAKRASRPGFLVRRGQGPFFLTRRFAFFLLLVSYRPLARGISKSAGALGAPYSREKTARVCGRVH